MSICVAEIDGEVTELAAIDDQRSQKVVHGGDGLVPRAGRRMHLYEEGREADVEAVDSDISTCAVRGDPCLIGVGVIGLNVGMTPATPKTQGR